MDFRQSGCLLLLRSVAILSGIVGMLIFIPLVSVLYTIFREFVYLRLKEKNIKQVTKTVVEEYTAEEIAAMEKNIKKNRE